MAVKTFSKSGQSGVAAKLDKAVFSVDVNDHSLLKQAYLAESANRRQQLAFTKTRGEIRGGGRKPWRQKGTGRARFGSIRNPIWRGGGIVFGPRHNNFSKRLSRSARNRALVQALTLANVADRVWVVDSLITTGKTTDLTKFLNKIGFKTGLLIVDEVTAELKRASSNIPGVQPIAIAKLSTADVLGNNQLMFTKPALAALSSRLGAKS